MIILIVHPLPSPTGLLFLSAPLDYETQRLHRLTVRAVDHGLPSLSSTQTLTVEVGDVNDQSPVFSQSVYNASVAENRDPGEPVIRVSATDTDSGNNHQLLISRLSKLVLYKIDKMGKCSQFVLDLIIHLVTFSCERKFKDTRLTFDRWPCERFCFDKIILKLRRNKSFLLGSNRAAAPLLFNTVIFHTYLLRIPVWVLLDTHTRVVVFH